MTSRKPKKVYGILRIAAGLNINVLIIEVDAAFQNKQIITTPDGRTMWQGVTPSGIPVTGYLSTKTKVYPKVTK
jgi:hypothetical protein